MSSNNEASLQTEVAKSMDSSNGICNGIYAGSHNSYHTYSQHFDKLIHLYHAHSPEAVHKTDMSIDGIADFSPSESEMIVSSRIRVGRNLAGFPLAPGLSKQ